MFKASDQTQPNVADMIKEQQVDLIVNLPSSNASNTQITDGFTIRRLAIDHHIPLITNLQIAQTALRCLAELHDRPVSSKPWRQFFV